MAVDSLTTLVPPVIGPVALITSSPAGGRIINGTTTTGFPSVGIVGDSVSGGFCSGTLIAPQYVLTAAHCADGVTNTSGRVQFGTTTYSTSQVIVHPNYNDVVFGTDAANDIAIFKLNTPVVGITPSNIFRSTPTVGTLLTLVGFGEGGTGNTGGLGDFGTKRVGTTPLDLVTTTLIHWNFDNNTESNTAPGDSGGPAFIQVSGEYLVAGVTSGGTLQNAGLGDQSYDTRVDAYQTWIDGVLNPVPTTNFIDYTTAGAAYNQNFNSLASTGTSSTLPSGWAISESGTAANATYTAGNGLVATGDTYSFGATGNAERALGTLQSGGVISTLGAAIKNNTGTALTSMTIGYVGEQWRLGALGRLDKLDFQYSLNATGLTDGTWVDVNALDFTAPVTAGTLGALDGNLATNRNATLSTSVSSLNIANGSTFWIRWLDASATGADDGLAVDDFSFTASGGSISNTAPTISTNLGLSVLVGSTANIIGTSKLAATDTQQTATQLTYTVTSLPAAGLLKLNGNAIVANSTTFTQADIDANLLTYDAAGVVGSSNFGFSVSDGLLATTGTFSLTTSSSGGSSNSISYTTQGVIYSQNFDTLAGTATASTLPAGWAFSESGTNANTLYTANDGAANSGDTYSFGTTSSTDRALGSLRSSSVVSTLGAAIQNNTSSTLDTITIGYVGEQWRLGTTARVDRLDFQYSLNASSLTDGTWTDVDAIDFTGPVSAGTIGALDGNLGTNKTSLSTTIGSLNIPAGSTIWIRWNDFSATGADDGLAIDDFTFSATGGTISNTAPTISNNLGLSVAVSSTANVIGNSQLRATDTQQTPSQLTFTVTSLPASGTLKLNGSAIVANVTTFTQANIDANALTYDAPATNGSTSFAFSVSDGLLSTTGTFALSITTANTAPTITTPSNQVTPFQTATPAIAFTVGDAETAVASLSVTASSSNITVVPLSGITLGGSGANRTVTLTPATGQSGTSIITLSVSDGALTTNTTFQLTVSVGTGTTTNLRIVSYNISGASSFGVRTGFEQILAGIGSEVVNGVSRQVDLFALQEVASQATTSTLIANSLNNFYGTTVYAAGVLDGGTTGSGTQGVVYNTLTLQLLGEALIGTESTTSAPRQTLRHHFRPIGTTGSADFYVYNSHLKASDSGADAQRRFEDVQVIRANADSLPQGTNILYVGDFNMFRSTENGYVHYLSAGNGQAFDPINRPGSWTGNASFKDIFTQAPSATIQGSLGLDGGGLDDRLDFQLNSGELNDGTGLEYRPGSYHTFGVNGSVAVNGSIDDSSNTVPLTGVANRLTVLGLLRTVSDHLPVVADYTFVSTGGNSVPTNITLAGSTIAENQPIGTTVGTLSTTDPDAGNTFSYSFVSGTGSTDNAKFSFSGNSLTTAAPINFETTPTLSIRVRTTDQGGLFFDKAFTINVTNVNASIANRRIFYNGSSSTTFGNGSGNPINAIDGSKNALLPGQTASFANYSSFINGLNGLVIDINGVGTLSASDLQFATWDGIASNGFLPTSAVPTVTTFAGGGQSGSTRVKLAFENNTIRNTWLRVTVLANSNTDLAANDVFYFGNAVGDFNVGNSGTPAIVKTDSTDATALRANQSPLANSALINNIYDVNKDGRVNATDSSLVKQNFDSALIKLFTAPASLRSAVANRSLAGSGAPQISTSPILSVINVQPVTGFIPPSTAKTINLGISTTKRFVVGSSEIETPKPSPTSSIKPSISTTQELDSFFESLGKSTTL